MRKKTEKTDIRVKILHAALPDVPFDGWTDSLLTRAAEKARVSDDDLQEAFPKGITDLIRYFSAWATAETVKKMTPAALKNMRVRDKITFGVQTRLDILTPHKEAMSMALSYMAKPPRNLALPKMMWDAADAIWIAAGDTATDYNRYTKRILLSGVLSTTGFYWLNDTSDGHEKTAAFLQKRIENVMSLGKLMAKSPFRRTKDA